MDRDFKLFVGVFDDLRERVQNQGDYDLIKAGGLLRQLILDRDRLIDIVNRTYRLPLKFEILNHVKINRLLPEWPHSDEFANNIEKEVIDLYWRNLDPSPAHGPVRKLTLTPEQFLLFQTLVDEATVYGEPPLKIENVVDEITGEGHTQSMGYNILRLKKEIPTLILSRDRFLKTKCILYNNHKYTVRDLVSSTANLRGGVHQGGKLNDRDRNLLDLDDLMKIVGNDASIAMMIGISHVVLKAIQPLYKRVLGDGS